MTAAVFVAACGSDDIIDDGFHVPHVVYGTITRDGLPLNEFDMFVQAHAPDCSVDPYMRVRVSTNASGFYRVTLGLDLEGRPFCVSIPELAVSGIMIEAESPQDSTRVDLDL